MDRRDLLRLRSGAGVRARIVPMWSGERIMRGWGSKTHPRKGRAGRRMRKAMLKQSSTGSAEKANDGAWPPHWSGVEAEVCTPRMLSALGNGVTGGKWCSLIDKVYGPATLG